MIRLVSMYYEYECFNTDITLTSSDSMSSFHSA